MPEKILATEFGGAHDHEKSAYTGRVLTDVGYYCALPYRFKEPRPKIKVTSVKTGECVICSIEDIGPWNIHDPYWVTNSRPQAESGHDHMGRKTNKAGIDLSPAAAKALNIGGMGYVNWEFV